MKVVYFAWVRERIGRSEEDLAPPETVETVADLLGWLKARGPGYEAALERPEIVRVAIDHEHVTHSTPVAGAREIALFPPMTGG